VRILRGRVALGLGHEAQARQILRRAAADEPQNIEAWEYLYRASGTDRPTILLSLGALARLDPWLRRSR
jgi:predicted Zn-dependent protease